MTLVVCGAALPARAQTSLDELEPASARTDDVAAQPRAVEVNGYVDNRLQYSYVAPGSWPVSAGDVPTLEDMLEGNVQLKIHLGRRAFVYADLSLIYQHSGPLVAPSELYATGSPRAWINLTAGKKRIVWGSGFAFNPTDLLNPPKDPTDPTFQRAGAWMARVELPLEKLTVTTLFAPGTLTSASGLPSSMLRYPSDPENHYLLAARLYLLLFDSDINVIYYFSNQYSDAFKNKSRIGVSASRYFGNYELHVESLFQMGSATPFSDHACAVDANCDPSSALSFSRLDDGRVYLRLIAGARTTFADQSLLSLEYYYQGDGYSDSEFQDLITVLARAQAAVTASAAPLPTQAGALPQRFVFNPLRQHYLIVSYSKPHIHDDVTIGATLIAGLRDLSGVFSPSVAWSAREWLTLALFAFVPFRGLPVGQARLPNGAGVSEFSLQPADFRALLEARAFF